MPTGERRRVRGFTYLWLLFVLAIGGATLAVAGQRWSTTLARDRERELLFRGAQIAAAIAAYRAAPCVAPPQWPRGLDELLQDRRCGEVRRHLRRAWADPFTGLADWVPVLDEDGGWRGVHSRSEQPARLTTELPSAAPRARAPRVSDHRFEVRAARAAPPVVGAPVPDPQTPEQ
jgi:type II secretory pathway pseudopilin PulG